MRRARLTLALTALLAGSCAWASEVFLGVRFAADAVPLEVHPFEQEADGSLYAAPSVWQGFGVVLTDEEAQAPRLSAQALGLRADVVASEAVVTLHIPMERKPDPSTQRFRVTGPAPKGVLVNYDLGVRHDASGLAWSLGHEARTGLFGGWLSFAGALNSADGQLTYTPGLRTWRRDVVEREAQLQVGDVISGRRNLSPTIQLLGVAWGSDASLAQRTRYALPVLGGVADLRDPASQFVSQPDPSQLTPGVNSGTVLRDRFGRELLLDSSFYFNPLLLAPGRWEYQVAAGRSERNGETTAILEFDRGMTDRWTTGAHLHAQSEGWNAGLTQQLTLGQSGALSLETATSSSDGRQGWGGSVGYDYAKGPWNLNVTHSQTSDGWWTLAEGHVGATQTTTLAASYTSEGPWSFQAVAAQVERRGIERTRMDLTARRRLDHGSIAFFAQHDTHRDDTTVGVLYSRPFGRQSQHYLQGRLSHSSRGVEAQALVNGRLGEDQPTYYAAAASSGPSGTSLQASLHRPTTWGEGDARVSSYDGDLAVDARWRGSMWLGQGGVMLARPTHDAFALVEVPGQPGLRMTSGGQIVSRTNSKGFALVPGLTGWQQQSVGVSSTTMPLGLQLDTTSKLVTAPRNGGVVVPFRVVTAQLQEVVLTRDGQPLPLGTKVVTPMETTFVALDGVTVLSSTEPGSTLAATWDGGACSFVLTDAATLDCAAP
jgi:outer membrane usher protein